LTTSILLDSLGHNKNVINYTDKLIGSISQSQLEQKKDKVGDTH
jgi:hypothetical protein